MQINKMSRTDAATKNLTVGVLSKMVLLGAAFTVRTIFIRILGVEYTGISSLFTNILNLLNLAELGLGSVFTFELYEPLHAKDNATVCAYVVLFKKIYYVIIAAICCIGMALIPFLGDITHSTLPTNYLVMYYLLYLVDSLASYFAVYRTTVIEADQKRYVVQYIEVATKLIQYVLQSIYLLRHHDFEGYLIIQVFFTILRNVLLHWIAGKMYPYLRNKEVLRIEQKTMKKIAINVKATFISRLSDTVMNQTDSIIISALIGVAAVGYYSNYNMIVVYINSIISMLFYAIEASVGNLNAEHDAEKSFSLFKNLSVWMAIMNAFCVSAYVCLVQNFIHLWIGEEYLQDMLLVICILFSFYMNQTMGVLYIYQKTMGLFCEVQKIYPFMAVLNIALSIWLGRSMGIAGVILATGIARGVTIFWYEGKIIFRKLEHSFKEYMLQQLLFALYTIATAAISYLLCTHISFDGFGGLCGRACTVAFVWCGCTLCLWKKTSEWKWGLSIVKRKIKRNGTYME